MEPCAPTIKVIIPCLCMSSECEIMMQTITVPMILLRHAPMVTAPEYWFHRNRPTTGQMLWFKQGLRSRRKCTDCACGLKL